MIICITFIVTIKKVAFVVHYLTSCTLDQDMPYINFCQNTISNMISMHMYTETIMYTEGQEILSIFKYRNMEKNTEGARHITLYSLDFKRPPIDLCLYCE